MAVRIDPSLVRISLGRAVATKALSRLSAMMFAVSVTFGLGSLESAGQVLMTEKPDEIVGVDAVERLGERIPLRLEFQNSRGETVPLAQYFDGEKPVVLMMGYFSCPVVCPTILNQMTASFKELDYTIGEDFRAVVVSIDPRETPTHALAEKNKQVQAYGRGNEATIADGWAFLVGEEEQSRALADSVGYLYKKLPNGEYSHPVVLSVLSPSGQITRYIYGFEYPADQVKLSLLDASEGKIAKSLGDRILHYCFRYDPLAGKYSMQAMAVMRIGGVLSVIGLSVFIGIMFAGERLRKKLGYADKPARSDASEHQLQDHKRLNRYEPTHDAAHRAGASAGQVTA